MSDHEVLVAVRALLDARTRWTNMSGARNAASRSVSWASKDAVCWCLYGAIAKVTGAPPQPLLLYGPLWDAAMALYGRGPFAVNDQLGHVDVLAMLDRAIAISAQAKEGKAT